MRSSLISLKRHTRETYNDINYIALMIAIVYPIELTTEQAIRAAHMKRHIPRQRKITRQMIRECIVYIKKNPGWKIDDLGQRYRVNSYELYTVLRKVVQKK